MDKDKGFDKMKPESEDSQKMHPDPKDRGSGRIFKVNISEDDLNSNSDSDAPCNQQRPDYKGEVYFANYSNSEHNGNNLPKPRSQPSTQKNKSKGPKKQRVSKLLLVSVISGILIATTLLSSIVLSCFNDVLPTTNRSDAQVLVKIPNDATTSQIIDYLDDNGLIKQRIFCKFFMSTMSKLKKSKKEPIYLGGTYYLSQTMGLERMLNELKEEQTAAETVTLLFPEGWTIYQMFNKIEEYEVCKAEHLYTAINDILNSYDYSKDLGNIEGRYLPLEGYYFPDTYEFYIGENANSVTKRFLDNFKEKWNDDYVARAKVLDLTIDEVINIASIIQKEAANKEQMGMVSSVIHNRLRDPINYPTIDCDSTYEYISKFVEPITGKTKASALMKTYNTYSCVALPAGPICSPGEDAIEAALYPENSVYYFFQHDNYGKIYMAKTAAEHDKNSLKVAKANSNIEN
ncbi:MAG TPA: endolytic transglycosylase MltG [Clostridia bacterium]|nr:endolytic transglycosylase MltG [Clostridia bacterium]